MKSYKSYLRVLMERDPSKGSRRIYDVYTNQKLRNPTASRLQFQKPISSILSKKNGFGSARTLFILGSGASVLDLCDRRWAHVRQSTSIGINKWPLHDFIPDVVSLEGFSSETTCKVIESCLARKEYQEQKTGLLLAYRPGYNYPNRAISKMNSKWYLPVRIPLYSGARANKIITEYVQLWWANKRNQSYLPMVTSSLDRLVLAGLFMGFKSIVLLGVDLSTRPYFFEENPRFFESRAVQPVVSGQPKPHFHKTDARNNHAMGMAQILYNIRVIANRDFSAEIYNGSGKSEVARTLPAYEWAI